jgi:fatty acid/phospholipid biosynthesis enzyme
MPKIKLDILQVGAVQVYADRSLDVAVVDRVRGPVTLRMQEGEARWLFASLADTIRSWQKDDE